MKFHNNRNVIKDIETPPWLQKHIHLHKINDTQSWVYYPFSITVKEISELKKYYEKYGYEIICDMRQKSEYTSDWITAYKIVIQESNPNMKKLTQGFEKIGIYYKRYFENEKSTLQELRDQIKHYPLDIDSSYMGSIHNLYTNEYPDRLYQFAYSLRKMIDLLCRLNNENSPNRIEYNDRIEMLLKVLHPNGGVSNEHYDECKNLIKIHYDELNKIVHHQKTITQESAENVYHVIRDILLKITEQQVKIVPHTIDIINDVPSDINAKKLKNMLIDSQIYEFVLTKLDPSWFIHLYNKDYFWRKDARIDLHNILYIIKCIDTNPTMIEKCILNFNDMTDDDKYYSIYWRLLQCVNLLPIDNIIRITKKIINENWSKYCYGFQTSEEYMKFALRLYDDDKCETSRQLLKNLSTLFQRNDLKLNTNRAGLIKQMLQFIDNRQDLIQSTLTAKFSDIFEEYVKSNNDKNSLLTSFIKSDIIDYPNISQELNEFKFVNIEKLKKNLNNKLKIIIESPREYRYNTNLKYIIEKYVPKFITKNPYPIIFFLVNMIDNANKYNSNDSMLKEGFLEFLIKSFKQCISDDKLENITKLHSVIKSIKSMTSNISKQLEYHIYITHDEYFQNTITQILIDGLCKEILQPEYRKLLYREFNKLDYQIQNNILNKICLYYEHYCDEYKREYDLDTAQQQKNQQLFTLLHPISSHLTNDWKREYELLAKDRTPSNLTIPKDDVQHIPNLEPRSIFNNKSSEEVFTYVKDHVVNTKSLIYYYDDEILITFKQYVINHHQDCYKHVSILNDAKESTIYTFLSGIRELVNNKDNVNWPKLFEFMSYISKKTITDSIHNIIEESCHVIHDGLRNKLIDYSYCDNLFETICALIHSNDAKNDDIAKLDDRIDTFTTSINNSNGLTFNILLEYERWYSDYSQSKDMFTRDIKPIINNYIINKEQHTISRNAVLGQFLNILAWHDEEWIYTSIDKIFNNIELKIAFWDSYILNDLTRNNMINMHDKYADFLNGRILNKFRNARIYKRTIAHVVLGYLYGLNNCNDMLMKFISKNNEKSIVTMCESISNIIEHHSDNSKFEDKLETLWTNDNVIKYGSLEYWFDVSHSDKNKSMELFINYLCRSDKTIDHIDDGINKLEKYIDDHPKDVIICMRHLVEKAIYLPDEEIRHVLSNMKLKTIKTEYNDLIGILMERNSSYGDFII